MLIIEYTADGAPVSDAEAASLVVDAVRAAPRLRDAQDNPYCLRVSTSNVVEYAQLMVATGTIRRDEIEFRYDGKPVVLSDQYNWLDWPDGFIDWAPKLQDQLARVQLSARAVAAFRQALRE